MSHIYSDQFFDYIDVGARCSARRLIGEIQPWIGARSVLDLGSGRGVWLDEWRAAGATDLRGIDGDYVDRNRLAIPQTSFQAADLTHPIALGRQFDVAQSLEVGEHLPLAAAQILVASLTQHANLVVFSAAVPGQGGEFHINEQPLSFWQDLFAAKGFRPFDCIRPKLKSFDDVEPWYKFNTILYANDAGAKGMPAEVLATEIPKGKAIQSGGSIGWKTRRTVVSMLPRPVVTKIAQMRAAVLVGRARRAIK